MLNLSVPGQLTRCALAPQDAGQISHRFTDVLVLGSGVAGLAAALATTETDGLELTVIAKEPLDETATSYAQGGVAAVLEPDLTGDSIAQHVEDTLSAAAGLADEKVVRLATTEGVKRVRELSQLGARWDRGEEASIHYTLEGGHSAPRILHRGDATGREIQRVLTEEIKRRPQITVLERTFAIDLIGDNNRIQGAIVQRSHGAVEVIWAKATILATGGIGQLFRETTNPQLATGDGIAMAFRAGAILQDLEFVQFHPTTLYVAGAERFLITEAVRGEGGVLTDADGRPFMQSFHKLADLAPRDVVSRAIVTVMRQTGHNKVYLDLSSIAPDRVEARFPNIQKKLRVFGIDILNEPIPVRPSAHYSIGGVRTNLDAQTNLAGLYAAGEVASTKFHGANRLASNSLLEGLVFGHRAGVNAARESRSLSMPGPTQVAAAAASGLSESDSFDLEDLRTSLRSLLWSNVGLERDRHGLTSALEQISSWIPYGVGTQFNDPHSWSVQNMLQVSYLLTYSALRREESRGVHFRLDFPQPDPAWQQHLTLSVTDLNE